MYAKLILREPATTLVTGLGAVVALVVALAHLNATQAGWLSGVVMGVATIIVAVLAHPPHVAVITGAAAEVISGLALFGFHPTPQLSASIIGVLTFLLGMLGHRAQLTPNHAG